MADYYLDRLKALYVIAEDVAGNSVLTAIEQEIYEYFLDDNQNVNLSRELTTFAIKTLPDMDDALDWFG